MWVQPRVQRWKEMERETQGAGVGGLKALLSILESSLMAMAGL